MDRLQLISAVLSIVHFSFTFIVEIALLVRARKRLDLSMIIVALAYLFAFLIRLPIFDLGMDLNILTATAFQIIWLSMYFFVFEMRRLQDLLTSIDLEEQMIKARRTYVIKWTVYITFLLANSATVYLQVLVPDIPDATNDFISIARGVILVPLNSYMLWLFLAIFRAFIERRGNTLTTFNRRVILVVYVMWLSYVVQALISTVAFTISLLSQIRGKEQVETVLKYLMGPVHWSLQFAMIIALLYMFDYQARPS